MSDARIVEVGEDGVATYRASALYSCFNALLLSRLGYDGSDAPEWMQQRFNAGHDHEPLILKKLGDEYGFNLRDSQGEVVIPVGSRARIVGHYDALHVGHMDFPITVTHMNGEPLHRHVDVVNDEMIVVDAKAFAVSTFETWCAQRFEAFPYYAWQMRAYLLGTGAQGIVMAVKNKNTDEMVVEYFTEEYVDTLVKRATLLKKVLEVEAAAKRGSVAIFENACTPMFPCPYFFMHPKDNTATVEGTVDRQALLELVKLRLATKARVDEAKTEADRIDAKIGELVGGKETTTQLDGITVSTYHSGSSSTDWMKMAEDFKRSVTDLKKKYSKATKSPKLSVKVTRAAKTKEGK